MSASQYDVVLYHNSKCIISFMVWCKIPVPFDIKITFYSVQITHQISLSTKQLKKYNVLGQIYNSIYELFLKIIFLLKVF